MSIARTRLVDRNIPGWRDARLYLIATEGTSTERQYFEGLRDRAIIDRSRVQLFLLPTPPDGTSAPQHVLGRIGEFERQGLQDFDERWLVLDIDRWPARSLSEVAQEAVQRRIGLAISNPCFELWLLLHLHEDVGGLSISSAEDCVRELRVLLGGYNKSRLDLTPYDRPAIERAIERARRLDDVPDARWPQRVGSHVHRLLSSLLGQG